MTILPTLFSLSLCLALMASVWLWIAALKKLAVGQPLLAREPRRTPRWGLVDLFMTVMFMFVLQGLAGLTLAALELNEPAQAEPAQADSVDNDQSDNDQPVEDTSVEDPVDPDAVHTVSTEDAAENVPRADSAGSRWMIFLSGVASLLACGLGALLVVLRTGSRWGEDLGLTLREAGRDVITGIVAFLMLAPIIYAIQLTLVQWYPSEHPLIESFKENPTLVFFLACTFSAAIVAPLAEEFICRVLLQGWLERVFASGTIEEAILGVPDPYNIGPRPLDTHDDDLELIRTQTAAITGDPSADQPAEDAEAPPAAKQNLIPGVLPILLSSLIFAALHFSHGPDPIPLFVLALGLGYLYQRTHRILPCVVLHFLVNAFSLAVLALSLVLP